jgi:hypothetical protein
MRSSSSKNRYCYVTAQVFRSQKSEVRMRDPSKKFEDLVVWRKAHQFVSEPTQLIEEVSKLLEAYMRLNLNSDS